MNFAGTELPIHDINEFISKFKENKIQYSIESMYDQGDSNRARWMEQRWSYKFKERPSR